MRVLNSGSSLAAVLLVGLSCTLTGCKTPGWFGGGNDTNAATAQSTPLPSYAANPKTVTTPATTAANNPYQGYPNRAATTANAPRTTGQPAVGTAASNGGYGSGATAARPYAAPNPAAANQGTPYRRTPVGTTAAGGSAPLYRSTTPTTNYPTQPASTAPYRNPTGATPAPLGAGQSTGAAPRPSYGTTGYQNRPLGEAPGSYQRSTYQQTPTNAPAYSPAPTPPRSYQSTGAAAVYTATAPQNGVTQPGTAAANRPITAPTAGGQGLTHPASASTPWAPTAAGQYRPGSTGGALNPSTQPLLPIGPTQTSVSPSTTNR